jgi:site-specific DNA-methyltransferase (adenine-specific)
VPYYSDELVTLYLGDCREIPEWRAASLLVTDPPYGRGWKQGALHAWAKSRAPDDHAGIAGDKDTSLRDYVLSAWDQKPAICFGDLMLAPPAGTKQVLVYQKPKDAGRRGTMAGLRRDLEAIYLIGTWPSGISTGRGSLFSSGAAMTSGGAGLSARYGHPHAKPVDLIEELIGLADKPALLADPFAGSGSILEAARNLGIKAVGVEIEEQYAEKIAKRLSQQTLFIMDDPPEQLAL